MKKRVYDFIINAGFIATILWSMTDVQACGQRLPEPESPINVEFGL